MREITQGGVRRLDLASGAEAVSAGTERGPTAIGPSAGAASVLVEDAVTPVLRFLDLKTHHVSRLTNLPGKPNVRRRGLAVSPDGSSLLFMSLDTEIGDIMLLDGIR
jgi:hypothetical protein